MVWLLLLGFALMLLGTILQVATGLIKELPHAVILGFAVIFVYIIAFSVSPNEAASMFVTSIPFLPQLNWFNTVLGNLGNVSDFGNLYKAFSEAFVGWDFWREAIKLWTVTFEVTLIHKILFPKKVFNLFIDWLLWYLREALAIGILIFLNSVIEKLSERFLSVNLIVLVGGVVIVFFAILILICCMKLIFHFAFPLADFLIGFFTKNPVGTMIIETTTTTGTLILVLFALCLLRIKLPNTILGTIATLPLAILFLLIWYVTYLLVGYRKGNDLTLFR